MYNIKLSNYIPEPTPATSDRIIAAHYYAAWKKGAAEIHEGFDDLCEEDEMEMRRQAQVCYNYPVHSFICGSVYRVKAELDIQ